MPFYTKVQTSAAVGEGPDVMTYHASRIPLAVSQGDADRDHRRRHEDDGPQPGQLRRGAWEAVHVDGKQYAVPFDTHPIVLYYNKDKLAAAGLIGDNGLPKDLNGVDNFKAALKKLKDGGSKWGISTVTADGSFAFRTIYSLLCQQDGIDRLRRRMAARRQRRQARQRGAGHRRLGEGRLQPVLHRLSVDRCAVHLWRRAR